jgi:hypothetical protein
MRDTECTRTRLSLEFPELAYFVRSIAQICIKLQISGRLRIITPMHKILQTLTRAFDLFNVIDLPFQLSFNVIRQWRRLVVTRGMVWALSRYMKKRMHELGTKG